MDKSCKLKLEWIPSAYNTEVDGHKSPIGKTPAKEVKQADILSKGLYQSGGGFSRQQLYKKKW